MQKELSSKLIYPNPFLPSGIEFELLESAMVTVRILDESGNEMATLVENKHCKAGKQVVPFDHSKYDSGSHAYQVIADMAGNKLVDTKRMR